MSLTQLSAAFKSKLALKWSPWTVFNRSRLFLSADVECSLNGIPGANKEVDTKNEQQIYSEVSCCAYTNFTKEHPAPGTISETCSIDTKAATLKSLPFPGGRAGRWRSQGAARSSSFLTAQYHGRGPWTGKSMSNPGISSGPVRSLVDAVEAATTITSFTLTSGTHDISFAPHASQE